MPKEPERKLDLPVSILMPVCNEAKVIEDIIQEWIDEVIQYLPEGSELLLDEAGSTDGTKEILHRLSEKYPFMKVTYRDEKDGFAAAARRLYAAAKCPLIFFTDSDGQYVASDFWKLAKFIDRYDVVHGVKLARKDPLFRRFFSMLFNKFAAFLFEEHYLDINSAFRLMRAEVVKDLLSHLTVMPSLLNAELLLRSEFANYEIKQVYVLHQNRKYGKSRGLPNIRYLWEGLKACWGLIRIKQSYRR